MQDISPERPITKTRLNILSFGNFLLTLFLISVTILGCGLIYQIHLDGFKEIFSGSKDTQNGCGFDTQKGRF